MRCITKSQSLPDIGASDLAVTALETLGVLRPSKIQVRRAIICPSQQHRLFISRLVNRAWHVRILMPWVASVLEDSTILAHTAGAGLALLDVARRSSVVVVQRCAFFPLFILNLNVVRLELRLLFVLPH